MEVHQHTHTPRKKWSHYFWEFLMLFLAVFCGFLAENQREHFIENKRARQYAALLMEDLIKDTSELSNRIIVNRNLFDTKRDSLLFYLEHYKEKKYGRFIYYYGNFAFRYPTFTSSDASFQQLRSSGSLRFIQNLSLYKSLTEYYRQVEFIRTRDNANEYSGISDEIISMIFNASDFHRIDPGDTRDSAVLPGYDPVLLTYDPVKINQFKHFVNLYRKKSMRIGKFLYTLKDNAGKIIIDLKKEYHLE